MLCWNLIFINQSLFNSELELRDYVINFIHGSGLHMSCRKPEFSFFNRPIRCKKVCMSEVVCSACSISLLHLRKCGKFKPFRLMAYRYVSVYQILSRRAFMLLPFHYDSAWLGSPLIQYLFVMNVASFIC